MTTAATSNDTAIRIATIRAAVTIFDVFERMGLQVTPETQQMRCPFHPDRSPSARVYADQNKLYCFTCQRGWDVIDAVATHWHLPMGEALTWIEREFALDGAAPPLDVKIRSQFFRKGPVDLRMAAANVEAVLYSHRQALGFARYTQLLQALDLTIYEFTRGELTAGQTTARLSRLVAAAA